MPNLPQAFNFATGVTVTIVTTVLTFTGELIDVVCSDVLADVSANNNNNNNNLINGDICFLVVRLTAATGPFPAGTVVRINVDQIVAIG